MDDLRKVVKRDIYRNDRRGAGGLPPAGSKDGAPACIRTAVVHCNQWECFTRYLCREVPAPPKPSVASE